MLQGWGMAEFNPELKALVVEASLALTRLDANRLEELALSCQALNRDLSAWSGQERTEMVRGRAGNWPGRWRYSSGCWRPREPTWM